MKHQIAVTSTLLSLGIFAACGGSEREIQTYNETEFEVSIENDREFYYEGWGNVDVFSAQMLGDIGDLTAIDGNASVQGYSEESYADLEILNISANGSAMHLLTFSGGLNHPSLVPGAHLEFSSGEYESSDEGALTVYSTNCSGTGEVYDWDYDTQADRVTIDVSETEEADVLRIDYTTEANLDGYMGPSQTSSGSFLVRR